MIHLHTKVPSKLATISVGFRAGARSETDKYPAGIAHMLEHMMFKGTTHRTYEQIQKDIARLGGSVNAQTSMESVLYYITVPNDDGNLDKAAEILSDMMFNSVFPEQEFLKEREVVKEEESSKNDDVGSFAFDECMKNFFSGKLAIPVIGTQDTISSFSRDDLVNFYNEFYTKENMIVSVSSNLQDSDASKLMTKYFGVADGSMSKMDKEDFVKKNVSKTLSLSRPETEQSHLILSYPSLSYKHIILDNYKNYAALQVMLTILGGGMDSRLFTEVRQKRGLVYGVSAGNISFMEDGMVYIYAATRTENLDEAFSAINLTIDSLFSSISEDELIISKNKYRAQEYAQDERCTSLATNAIAGELFCYPSKEECSRLISSVTENDVIEMAKRIFNKDNYQITIVNPL